MTWGHHVKGMQAICKVPTVVVCSGLGFLLISRDLASGTRCLDLVLQVLFSKKFKERDGRHPVPSEFLTILIQWLEKIFWLAWGDVRIWSLPRKRVLACWSTPVDLEQDTGLPWGLGMFCAEPLQGHSLWLYICSRGAVVASPGVWSKSYNT